MLVIAIQVYSAEPESALSDILLYALSLFLSLILLISVAVQGEGVVGPVGVASWDQTLWSAGPFNPTIFSAILKPVFECFWRYS